MGQWGLGKPPWLQHLDSERTLTYPHRMTTPAPAQVPGYHFPDPPAVEIRAPAKWTANLALEDALELFSDQELCDRHTVSVGELTAFRATPIYRRSIAEARKEITEQGLTFKVKARLQAERFLDAEVPRWMADVDAPIKDKAALLAKLVEWGELGPKPAEAAGSGSGFTFVLNLGGEQQTIHTPVLQVVPAASDTAPATTAPLDATPELPASPLGAMPDYLKPNGDLG